MNHHDKVAGYPVRVVRLTPGRTIMAVVRDAAAHTPPVIGAPETLEGVSATCA